MRYRMEAGRGALSYGGWTWLPIVWRGILVPYRMEGERGAFNLPLMMVMVMNNKSPQPW